MKTYKVTFVGGLGIPGHAYAVNASSDAVAIRKAKKLGTALLAWNTCVERPSGSVAGYFERRGERWYRIGRMQFIMTR